MRKYVIGFDGATIKNKVSFSYADDLIVLTKPEKQLQKMLCDCFKENGFIIFVKYNVIQFSYCVPIDMTIQVTHKQNYFITTAYACVKTFCI